MNTQTVDPDSAPAATGGYTQGLLVAGLTELLVISGQVPETPAGDIPGDFGHSAVKPGRTWSRSWRQPGSPPRTC